MQAPTYYDTLLGQAGTGAAAYDVLERIGALSDLAMAERRQVVEMIDAGFRAPWVGPVLPGSPNQHPDADILGNLFRRGYRSRQRIDQIAALEMSTMMVQVRGLPRGLAMILAPVFYPDETVVAWEKAEDITGHDPGFQAIVA